MTAGTVSGQADHTAARGWAVADGSLIRHVVCVSQTQMPALLMADAM